MPDRDRLYGLDAPVGTRLEDERAAYAAPKSAIPGPGGSFANIPVLAIAGICAGGALVVILGYLALMFWSSAKDKEVKGNALATQNAVLAAPTPTPVPTPTPSCAVWRTTADQVSDLVNRGRFETAADVAALRLGEAPGELCAETASRLARLWYNARMDALIDSQPAGWYSRQFDENVVAQWHAIEADADRYTIPAQDRWPERTIVDRAYDAHLWALADAAFMKAWVNGKLVDAPSQKRYALLRNWGHALAKLGDPEAQELALRLLATAVAISDRYNLRDDLACRELVEVLGIADCRTAAPDLGDPLLAAPEAGN